MPSKSTPPLSRNCEICGSVFHTWPSRVRIGAARFCSPKCRAASITQANSVDRTCERCGKPFTVTNGKVKQRAARFCSRQCLFPEPRVARSCGSCGIDFLEYPSVIKKGGGLFCSVTCYRAGSRLDRECEMCGQPFTAKRHVVELGHARYCSQKCQYEGQTQTIEQVAERFWSLVDSSDPNGCWFWQGSRFPESGYGQFKSPLLGTFSAHRTAYVLTHGPLSDDLVVRHSVCGNGKLGCVRPDHLEGGTPHENSIDTLRMGRAATKLNDELVRAIRQERTYGDSCVAIAARHGISPITVSRVARRVTWKHVA